MRRRILPGDSLFRLISKSPLKWAGDTISHTVGVATVVPKASGRVYGVLWYITEADEQALDEYEEVDQGVYYKVTVEVETDAKGTVQALTYVASKDIPGPPMPGYLEDIVAAARATRATG